MCSLLKTGLLDCINQEGLLFIHTKYRWFYLQLAGYKTRPTVQLASTVPVETDTPLVCRVKLLSEAGNRTEYKRLTNFYFYLSNLLAVTSALVCSPCPAAHTGLCGLLVSSLYPSKGPVKTKEHYIGLTCTYQDVWLVM